MCKSVCRFTVKRWGLLVLIVLALTTSFMSYAEDVNNILDDTKLSYPELEVTPRASERLEIEARNEIKTHWTTHLPIQFSAIMTLAAAMAAQPKSSLSDSQRSNFNSTKNISIGVGAGWLALTVSLSALYRPYLSGYREISHMPNKTEREQLTRERIAEEALYAPEDLGTKLKWFSVISNLAANLALMDNSDQNSKLLLTAGAVSVIAPILFNYRWVRVAEQHKLYKKKIYGPVASSVLLPVTATRYSPGVGLLWTF